MNKPQERTRIAIGLMSGTSADGVDAALIRIGSGFPPHVEVSEFQSIPYSGDLRRRVLIACGEPGATTAEICSLHRMVGEAFADASLALLEAADIPKSQVDFIGSHGQTIRHLPEGGEGPEGAFLPSTLQLGDPGVISERTGCTVISDFRARDVAAGGCGAPLTPWAHRALFGRPDTPVAFLNLGGISNLTYIPPLEEKGLFGFDAGPANMTLDAFIERVTGGKELMDRDGAMAGRGHIDESALDALMDHPYLSLSPPKSTGREMFGEAFLDKFIAPLEKRGVSAEDQLETLTDFSAQSTLMAIQDHFPAEAPPVELIVGGGGIHNKTLMRHLREGLAQIPVVSSAQRGVSPGAVEAVSFALLAWGTLRGEATNVPAATGAAHETLLGNITPGKNYLSIV